MSPHRSACKYNINTTAVFTCPDDCIERSGNNSDTTLSSYFFSLWSVRLSSQVKLSRIWGSPLSLVVAPYCANILGNACLCCSVQRKVIQLLNEQWQTGPTVKLWRCIVAIGILNHKIIRSRRIYKPLVQFPHVWQRDLLHSVVFRVQQITVISDACKTDWRAVSYIANTLWEPKDTGYELASRKSLVADLVATGLACWYQRFRGGPF